MEDNKRIELLGKLAAREEINRILKDKNRDFFLQSIGKSELQDYLDRDFEIYKEYKSSYSMKKSKSHDVDFEDKLWSMFALLGYDFINKDRNFHLPYDNVNSQQIDVFAKDNETVIIVECKSANSNKRGDFKKELEAMGSKMSGLKKSVQNLFPGVKLKFKYILATRNLALSEVDSDRLLNLGGVHFSEETVDYFMSLYSQIGTSAKYQLLGFIFEGQEIPNLENRIPAVEGKMGGFNYYSFSIEPEKLLKICYVLHRNKANSNMMPTYQRLIKKSRLKSVKNFIDDGGYFPNSIVISIDSPKLIFEKAATSVNSAISNIGVLHLPKKYRSAYVIDGQHRLYGYTESKYKSSNSIPVVAFVNLSRSEQIKLFMQINENQKAVSKDLRNTLNADLLWDSPDLSERVKALCSRLSIHLGESRDSALFGKVSIGEDKKIITQQAIENSLKKCGLIGKVSSKKIETLGSFYSGDIDKTYDDLKSLLKFTFAYFEENLKSEWNSDDSMILINKGIFGIIMILGDIVDFLNSKNIIDSKRDTVKSVFSEVKTYLDPIIVYINHIEDEVKNELKSSYGAGGETKYWRWFQRIVSETHSGFDPNGMEEYFHKEAKMYNDKAFSYIREIELTLKKVFKEKLEEFYGVRWFTKGVPPKIADSAIIEANNKTRELDESEAEDVEPWDCINIIAYREIAIKNWQNIFELYCTRPGEEKMNGGKEAKTKWMQRLERIRNQNVHTYSVTEDELSFLSEIHYWLTRRSE